jgi:hypothetical protein
MNGSDVCVLSHVGGIMYTGTMYVFVGLIIIGASAWVRHLLRR